MKKILLTLFFSIMLTALFAQVQYLSGGSSGAYTLTHPSVTSTVTAGLTFTFKANHTNTGASFLSINGSTAVVIKKSGSSGLVANDILSGQIITVVYDGTNFQLLTATGNTGWGVSGNSGTTSGTHFIGTTNTQDLDIRTNNVIMHRFTQKGQIEFLSTGNSVFIGENAGENDDLTTNNNVFVGKNAGLANSDGTNNIAIGSQSMSVNTSGSNNIAIGQSLNSNVTGFNNVAIGKFALNNNTTSGNTAVGYDAMNLNSTGLQNVAFGFQALKNNLTSSSNSAFGYQALLNTTGQNNTGVGLYAGSINTIGSNNTFIGHAANAGAGLTGLSNATAIGSGATVSASNSLILGNGANVGIGTSTPSQDLDIVGTAEIDSLRINNSYSLPKTVGANGELLVLNGSDLVWQTPGSGDGDGIYDASGSLSGNTNVSIGANRLSFTSSAANAFSVDGTTFSVSANTNRVGIGTVTPQSKLEINGGDMRLINSTNGIYITESSAITNGYGQLFFDVDVLGAGSPEYVINFNARFNNNVSSGNFANIKLKKAAASNDAAIIFEARSQSTAVSEKMRITGDGDIGIGTSSPSEKLDVDDGGSIEVDGDYTYESAKTHYLSVGANLTPNNGFDLFTSGGGVYSYFPTGAGIAYATANIYLPDGAVITRLDAWLYDNDGTESANALIGRQTHGATIFTSVASISTTVQNSIPQQITSGVLAHTVNNNTHSYKIRFTGIRSNTNIRFYSARITYTVTKAD